MWNFKLKILNIPKNSPQKRLFLKENLPLFIFSVSIFEMLIIELKLFDSGLTFLWFRTSIFSFRSVRLLRLSWFWRSLVWPFSNIRSASNFKLLSPELHFIQSYQVFFYQSISVFKAFFSTPGKLLSRFSRQVLVNFWSLLFGLFLKSLKMGKKVFWNKMWMGSFLFWIW